jgi:branched-chain amino acid transport system substrate-binding protein
MHRSPIVVVVALAAAVLLLAGWAGGRKPESPAAASTPSAKPTGKPIVLGVEKGLTGFWSTFDAPGLLGIQIAVDQINAAGGVAGRPLKIDVCDAKSDVNQSAACGLQLIENGAQFLLTTCDYDFGGPAAREANKAKIISIGCGGAVGFGATGIGPYHYNTYAGNPAEAATIAEYAYNKLGFRKPYLLTDLAIEYTKSLCKDVEKAWNALAGEGTIAGKDTFLNGDASIAPQVSQIRSSNADSLIVCSFVPGGASAFRQIRGGGIKLPIFGTASFDGSYWLKSVPGLSNFTNPAPLNEWGDPINNPLVDKIVKRTGKPPAVFSYALNDYSAMYILKKAIEAAGSTDADAVKAVLDTWKKEPTPTGPTTYTPNCHISLDRGFAIVKVENGKRKYVGDYTPKTVPKSLC